MKNVLSRLVKEDSGQDLIEYALLAAFISLAALIAMRALGTAIGGKFDEVSGELGG